jgi:NADH:ubiquinone oxidoreductase subunit C
VSGVLARRDRALTPEETEELLRDRLGDGVRNSLQEFGIFTVWIAQDSWSEAARRCRDEPLLAYDMFDHLTAVDAREHGFDVLVVLYSTSTGNRIVLRTRCEGGREAPTCPSITETYRGANWMEREAYDMFGIDFPGHPSLEPRLLTVENFEGYPLRKDFHLTSRAAKPWPGVAEPKELDEEGNVIEKEARIGDAPGPYELDKAMAEQAKLANPLPEPETVEGEIAEELAEDAQVAPDSGEVLAGTGEQAAETLEKQATEQAAADADAETQGSAQAARAKAEQRRQEQVAARARKAAERADPGSGGAAADGIDQETFDRLIAEGKSERIARSKAKAAYIKRQRAEQRAAEGEDDGGEQDA